ncbi:hypothetical protein [Sphaerospermopsis sp. LEGE 08334]|uniref:hypothetical protein n=1 Tax=Sphaerospermopsis sp. LEGE 08334 TaxID=1828651 RepID=UPI0018801507|nr:hypothetical protein [Sphaerospermopsis sp. LEGE 08334]MBE9059348.1 hypothetical protein [Sphaerospermopsis sp. LEGE 08334]
MTELSKAAKQVVLIRNTLKYVYNPLVEKWFNNVARLGTKRGELKQVCLVDEDDDSLIVVLLRLFFFYFICGYFRQGLANFYGSKFDRETDASKHPQLFIYFSQDSAAVPDGISKVDKEKSVRLLKINQSVTKTQLVELAREIKQQFIVDGKGWTYVTGKIAVSYLDENHGFYRGNYVLVNNKQDGIDLYRKICNIIDAPFDEDKITISNPEKPNLGTTQKTINIAGKKYKEKRYRPVATVRFRYAYLAFGGTIPPFWLIDLTGKNFVVKDD